MNFFVGRWYEDRGLSSSFAGDKPEISDIQRKWGVLGAYVGCTIVLAVCACIVYLMVANTDYRMGLLVVIVLGASTFGLMTRFAPTELRSPANVYSPTDLTSSGEETRPLAADS